MRHISASASRVLGLALVGVLLTTLCPPASAATITATFSGTVQFPDPDLPYAAGTLVSGSFSYLTPQVANPTNYPLTNPTPMGTANYFGNLFTLSIGADTYSATFSNIGIGDTGNPLIVQEFMSVSGPPTTGPAHGAYVPTQISLLFIDTTGTVFSSDALPPPPMLTQSSFTGAFGSLEFFRSTPTFDSASVTFSVDAFLLPAAPVPEPSTYALMLAGLGLIGYVAHRRRRSNG